MNEVTSHSKDEEPLPMQAKSNEYTDELETPVELLGAIDIVESFTALRHELKLQIRNGRELQQSVRESVQRLEHRIESSPLPRDASDSELRKMAEAIADIEESLQRAIESIVIKPAMTAAASGYLQQLNDIVAKAPWIARTFAGPWLKAIGEQMEKALELERKSKESPDASGRGLELLLDRVRRWMKQFDIERVNVLNLAFNPETMNAIDSIVAPNVPRAHVAQQLRPLYLWRNQILRCAEVRIAN